MECAESLRAQAYFDGEVDASTAFEIERHVSTCGKCQQLLRDLVEVRDRMRGGVTLAGTPDALREGITRTLDDEAQVRSPRGGRRRAAVHSRPFWIGMFSGAVASAMAAGLAFVVFSSLFSHGLSQELIADHTHSLIAAHLIDVVSTDQHTVRPWFAGRTDVSPVVGDFTAQGYRLLGGRVAELNHRREPVTVYQHGRHIINVFSWSIGAAGVPRDATLNGYHLAFWKSGNVGYCAVSDTGWSELQALRTLLQDQAAREDPRE